MKRKTSSLKNKLLDATVYKLLKILRRKGMSTQLQMENTLNLEPGSWLMWIKSDKIGTAVEISGVDESWINFTDGSRCSIQLAPEYMANTSPAVNTVSNTKHKEAVQSIEETFAAKVEPVKEPADPIVNMLKTLSKKNTAKFDLSIDVKIPSPAIYAVMTSELEEDDLREAISKMIVEQIDINTLKEQIKSNTHSFINNYYGK